MATMRIIPDCSICRESLKTPKVLPCGHTFCLCCIKRCIADKRETFPCPFCKQAVQIPKGGAKESTTNYIAYSNQPHSTTQHKYPNYKQKEVDYYCNNCNVGLCFRCISKQHIDHEQLDIECEETRNKAIEKLKSSQRIMVISKPFNILGSQPLYIPGSYQFLFNVSDIKKNNTEYYSKNKFRNNNLVWCCSVMRLDDDPLYIDIKLLPDDNPKLDYCIIDGQISLLNINKVSKIITKTFSNRRIERDGWIGFYDPITWSKLSKKRNGYLNYYSQFMIQYEISQIRQIRV